VRLVVATEEVGDGPDQGGEGGVAHGGSILWRRVLQSISPCSRSHAHCGRFDVANQSDI
jgi:hypothetical protein